MSTPPARLPVGIVGAGPAGLFLALLLHQEGIASVVLDSRSRAEIEGTIRAGVLEDWTARLMRDLGLGERMDRLSHVHDGITLQFSGERHHLDFRALTGGRGVTVYPQHEVLTDLIAALERAGVPVLFGVQDVTLHAVTSDQPRLSFRRSPGAAPERLNCQHLAGCDGFHGPSRRSIPSPERREYQQVYPFGWLGVLVQAPPSYHELIYARHERGFALLSTRSPEIQRLYVQCDPADDLAQWPDERIWEELHRRLDRPGAELTEGPIFQKNIVGLRSFVCEPMRYGQLYLAGDAAHIVPPTGAKGLNLAVGDVLLLSRALTRALKHGDPAGLDSYSQTALRRVWRAERFSWFLTTLLHRDPAASAFEERIRLAELDYLVHSEAASRALAENYVGLPVEG